MNEAFFDDLKRYVGFGDEDARILVALRPLLVANAQSAIDVFYDRILEHPRANKAITGGPVQVERLKGTLRRWLVELGDGTYGRDYLERRAAIGRRHVLIELPQVFMVTAMNVIRRELAAAIRLEFRGDAARIDRSLEALHKILDMDLAVMLETYQEDSFAKVARAERKAAIGELAAPLGHELRRRLAVIKSSAFLLEKHLPGANAVVTGHVSKIQRGAESAGVIMASLLALAREYKPAVVLMDMNAAARDASASIPPRRDVVVELELAHGLPRVPADPELIQSVLANLIANAVESHAGAGRVVVATERSARGVTVRVRDEGSGLAPDVEARLFHPFFTTKEARMGLGLAVSREIVLAHEGRIDARNRPDTRGAEFSVDLPLAGARP